MARQKEIYDKIYFKKERDYWSDVRIELFKNREFGKVLDIGCGSGYGSKILKNSGYVGMDISLNAGYLLDKFVVADSHNLPFKTNTFDTVLLFEVIEHLKNIRKALYEVMRVLKKGGRIIITTPNKKNFFVNFYENVKKNKTIRKIFGRESIEGEQHEKLYTKKEIESLLKKNRFNKVDVKAEGLGIAFLFSFLVYGRFSTVFSKNIIRLDYMLPAINGQNIIAEAQK